MFASPFFGGGGWGGSPYEQDAYYHDPYARQRQAEAERRRNAQLRRQRQYERELQHQRQLEMEQQRREEEYERALYEQELARRRRRQQPEERIEYDFFGRPYRVRVQSPQQQRATAEQRKKQAAAHAAAQAEAHAAREAEQAKAAEKTRVANVRRFRRRVAATKIQRWWREYLDLKYNPTPDPRIEEVDEMFVLPRHRVLADSIDNVVMPLTAH